MRRNVCLILVVICLSLLSASAQTTNGLITGTITDPSGAVISDADIDVTNQGTNVTMSAKSDGAGSYIFPQLPPGLYDISIKKEGFATETQSGFQLGVNQSATLDFKLTVSSSVQTVKVSSALPSLNTTSATLQDVVQHEAIVDLPLNGREFTQLTLLSPGAAPVQNSQQNAFNIALGAGGISPSLNGQRGEENNFTMDGLLNNQIFMNTWTISPPPDALQEFNVQSHITDAQFAISSGANINIVTRPGTNDFHGSVWEFARNAAFDANSYFSTSRLPYNQHQYGVYFGGPVILPHFHGKDNTWVSGYWEGFRAVQTLPQFANTFTAAEAAGDFSAFLGPQVGTDSLGRPEYRNEIYDPATSRPDPNNPGAVLRDPFPGNIIPTGRLNSASLLILKKYYPAPNLAVAPTVFPNLEFPGTTTTASDTTGIRVDHHFSNNDSLFGRYNRSNVNKTSPNSTPGYLGELQNYAQVAAAGYTHLFGPSTLLSVRYGWSDMNLLVGNQNPGAAFIQAINYSLNYQSLNGPSVSITNGLSGVTQYGFPLGPQKTSDYHADLSKVIGHHTLGVGGMYYHIWSFIGTTNSGVGFTQNATSQAATPGPTGYGPASFLLGLPDSLSGVTGKGSDTFTVDWFGGYVQDQWQASKNLTITAGLRYDLALPPLVNIVTSGLDFYTGTFIITEPFLPLFPKATGPRRFLHTQYNGFEPRFGIAYRASNRTVLRSAIAILDDNNRIVQCYGGTWNLNWPTSGPLNLTLQNRGLPNLILNDLPPASSFIDPLVPVASQDVDPHSRIPYAIEYNLGVEQQLTNSVTAKLDYVGSVGRHLLMQENVNGAVTPGPGPLASRGQPYPQYTVFTFDTNVGTASYNALQADLRKSVSAGLFFTASYTWSKSLDLDSDPYANGVQNFYDLSAEWGPSDFNIKNLFVFSGVYALPFGRDQRFLSTSHGITEALLGNWNIAGIVSLHSGEALECVAGADVANVGAGTQRCDEIGQPYSGAGFQKTSTHRLNPASFTTIPYTFGTERRNDLIGPSYNDVDFSVLKNFPIFRERVKLETRADFFNVLNHPNFANPANAINSASFGTITSTSFPREIQFAAKVTF
jgi:hypothetical protein